MQGSVPPVITEEPISQVPLAGTSDDPVSPTSVQRSSPNIPHVLELIPLGLVHNLQKAINFEHEIFLSQARMMEAIDALARKVEDLSQELKKVNFVA